MHVLERLSYKSRILTYRSLVIVLLSVLRLELGAKFRSTLYGFSQSVSLRFDSRHVAANNNSSRSGHRHLPKPQRVPRLWIRFQLLRPQLIRRWQGD